MPKTQLPSSFKGWVTALAGSLAGLLAGFVTINWIGKVWK